MPHRLKRGSCWLAAACCVAAGMPGCGKKHAAAAAAAPLVQTVAAVRRPVDVRRSWTGVLDGSANVEVRTRVTGYLLEQLFTDGSVVKQGAPLFLIDPRPFEATLRQAQAARLQAVAQQTKTEQDAARFAELIQRNSVSKQDYEHAVQANEAAKANVAAADAVVDQAKLNLEFTKITSEVDGIAGFANPHKGDLVGPNDPKPLTTVSTVEPIKVSFQISEQEYLQALRAREASGKAPVAVPEAPLTLVLADRTQHPHLGKWVSISREVNTQTGTFEVTAHFPNPGNKLRPGQFARVETVVATLDAVLVPQRAVLETQGAYQLAVVGAGGKVEVRPVKTGPRDGSEWAITSGLKEGETVIVEGLQKVKTGMAVTATPWAKAPPDKQSAAPAAGSKSQPEAP